MKKSIALLLALLTAFAFIGISCGGGETKEDGPVTLSLWTKEGEADGTLQWVESMAAEFSEQNPNVTIEVLNKNVETLREDFQTAALAGTSPDLLWTVSDHAGPFVTAGLIKPVDSMFDMDKYVQSVEMQGKTWAVPISTGNHLMLIYNKALLPEAPKDTDEMIAKAKELTTGDQYGLVFNLGEAFWAIPWIGGFGGSVFEADGVTPSLDTPEMKAALTFMKDLKFKHGITPIECDYNGADTLFKDGKAAMIINGDWSLGTYQEILGDNLGTTVLPKISSTGKYPSPYTAGTYFMIPEDLDANKEAAVKAFVEFVTSEAKQKEMLEKFSRLPALLTALDDPSLKNDPILKGSAEQVSKGTPQPNVLEMRAIWDAINPQTSAVMAGSASPEEAVKAMQSAAEAGIAAQK